MEFGPVSNWIAGMALLITVVDRIRQERKSREDRKRAAEHLRKAYLVASWDEVDRLYIKNAGHGTATNIRCRVASANGEPLPIEQDIVIRVLNSGVQSLPFVFTRLPRRVPLEAYAGQATLQKLNAQNDPGNWRAREQAALDLMPDAIFVSLEWKDAGGGDIRSPELLGKPKLPF
jgi:hypothetical protein